MHSSNASYDHERLVNSLAIGERARWTWTVPDGEVWRLLWIAVENTDSGVQNFRAFLLTPVPLDFVLDQVAVPAVGGTEMLLLKVPASAAGFDRRGSDIWLPSGFSMRVSQLADNAIASIQACTLAWARYDSVRGRAVTEGTAAQI